MRWFRMYGEMLDDEKVQMLSPELFKTWVNLLAVASIRGGALPPVDGLAFKLRVSKHEMQQRLEDLVLAGLIDIRPDGRHEPHNWQQRQWKSDDSKERVRKHRATKRRANGAVTVTVTPPESESESESESYDLPSSQAAARVDDQKVLKPVLEGRKDGKKERVIQRAEGLGLPVEKMIEALNAQKGVKKRSAYFTTLCIERLQKKHPELEERLIRDALWERDDSHYKALMHAILETA